jgi:type VI protein secretion system component VasK
VDWFRHVDGFWLLIGLLVVVAVCLHFWPTVTAIRRRHPTLGGVILLNVLLGWTVIGWVAALVWSYSQGTSPRERRKQRHLNESAAARKWSTIAAELPRGRPMKGSTLVAGHALAAQCSRCGRAVSGSDAFCAGCGAAIA